MGVSAELSTFICNILTLSDTIDVYQFVPFFPFSQQKFRIFYKKSLFSFYNVLNLGMPYVDPMQKSYLYTVFFAPRGFERMAYLGMQVAQQYLSPFDKLIGIVGLAGSGKSMMIKGMFPGLELVNDDDGVNIRPLPLLDAGEETTGFYSAHTYHVDIHFEAAFTQMHVLAQAILDALNLGSGWWWNTLSKFTPSSTTTPIFLSALGRR
jgi:hypothetical protein